MGKKDEETSSAKMIEKIHKKQETNKQTETFDQY
jgi:hypothetical protein